MRKTDVILNEEDVRDLLSMNRVRYAVWNNKGGVGKTFLSFVLSSGYALEHSRSKKVIVVDMCPQANLSEILLGGNSDGSKHLEKLINENKTIGGYFDSRIRSVHNITGNETAFLIQVSQYNPKIPENIFLIVGDPRLEIQAQVMNQLSNISQPEDSWKNVHSWLLDLIKAGEDAHGKDITTFIDCNPSFSAYTITSLLAATYLIVPCSSDGSSARAIDNLARLIYGYKLREDLRSVSLSGKAKTFNMALPKMYCLVLNRSTQYRQKASKAFQTMFEEIRRRVESFKEDKDSVFYNPFEHYDIPDAHSPAIVCSHKGLPITKLHAGPHQIHGERTQVNPEPLEKYKEAIDGFVKQLV